MLKNSNWRALSGFTQILGHSPPRRYTPALSITIDNELSVDITIRSRDWTFLPYWWLHYVETTYTCKFINKIRLREDFHELPVGLAVHRAVEENYSMGKYYVHLKNSNVGIQDPKESIKNGVISSVTTRMVSVGHIQAYEFLSICDILTFTIPQRCHFISSPDLLARRDLTGN